MSQPGAVRSEAALVALRRPPKDQVELDPPTISAQRIHSFRMRLAVERP